MRVWDCLGPRFPRRGRGAGEVLGLGSGREGSEGELKSEPQEEGEIYSPAMTHLAEGKEEQTPPGSGSLFS